MFRIRVHGEEKKRYLNVKTTIYRDAAAAVPAIFGLRLPVDIEIWAPHLIPEYGPYHYRIRENEFGGITVEHLLSAYQQKGKET